MIAAIKAACEPLRLFPQGGPRREVLVPGLRVTFHDPYAIYYTSLPDAVVVIRVLHGARDVTALAERRAFDA